MNYNPKLEWIGVTTNRTSLMERTAYDRKLQQEFGLNAERFAYRTAYDRAMQSLHNPVYNSNREEYLARNSKLYDDPYQPSSYYTITSSGL